MATGLLVSLALPAVAARPGGAPPAATPGSELGRHPGVASAADVTNRLARLAPSAAVVHRDAGGRLVDDTAVLGALTAVHRHDDLGAWLRSRAAAVRAASPTAPAPLVVAPPAAAAGDEAEPAPAEGRWSYPVPAGDLDGDGRADVLVYDVVLHGDTFDLTMSALRGLDGTPLWSLPLGPDGGLAYPLGRDVTGDGADDLMVDDLVVHEMNGSGESDANSYRYTFTARYTSVYGVRSGSDGSAVWQQSADGSIDETESGTTDDLGVTHEDTYRLRSSGLAVLLFAGGDLDGDQGPDVVADVVGIEVDDQGSSRDAVVAGTYDETLGVRTTTDARVLSGRSGAPSLHRGATSTAALSLLLPAGPVAGRPGEDLLWTTEKVRSRSRSCVVVADTGTCTQDFAGEFAVLVTLLDGGQNELWTVTAPGSPWLVRPLGFDADGDGTGEVVRQVMDGDGGATAVLSGADGHPLWTSRSTIFPPWVLGAQAAPTGQVVALGWFDDVAGGGAGDKPVFSSVVELRDGRTGQVLRSETRPVPLAEPPASDDLSGGFSYVNAYCAIGLVPDADGNGVKELLVGSLSEAGTEMADGSTRKRARSSWSYADVLDQRQVFLEETDDSRAVFPLGDVDGDGLLDLERDVITEGPPDDDGYSTWRTDTTAFRARDRAPLWSFLGGFDLLPYPAGDMDGQPGEELLRTRSAGAPGAGDVIESLRGQDLALRWSR